MATSNKNTVTPVIANEVANETPETGLQVSQTQNLAPSEIQTEEGTFVAIEISQQVADLAYAALASLPQLTRGIELTAEYMKMVAGEQIRGIYIGLQGITPTKGSNDPTVNTRINANGLIDAAKIMIESDTPGKPKMVIMADAVIVSTLRDMKPATAISITCKGEAKSKNGTYKQFSIEQLFAGK